MIGRKKNFWREKKKTKDIAPDEIFLDSSNLPKFDTHQFEGRLEKPISKKTFAGAVVFFILIGLVFLGRAGYLQIVRGEALAERAKDNNLQNIIKFSERGVIYDRNGVELAWNTINESNSDFSKREYINKNGLSHILGFLNYPKKDKFGRYYEYSLEGVEGIEKYYNKEIGGENGLKIIEIDVFGDTLSESIQREALDGSDLVLSIDYRVQSEFYKFIKEVAGEARFQGGSGVIMDVNTGEILAMASFPEFDSKTMTEGTDTEAIELYNSDKRKPFLNRAVSGLYTPGSIIKPFVALATLDEEIISPEKEILSTGKLVVPNPYDPEEESVFKDWKAHGWVDMKEAIAQSSNVYFYVVGGGFENQEGLGITKIERHLREFGFGEKTGIDLSIENEGVVPNPRWKREIFNDDWRLGDTYITSIGQFGFQITPIQAARSVALIANGGKLLEPTTLKNKKISIERKVEIDEENFKIVREGMREAVTRGTASALNFPYVKIAAKTGTAEIGALKESVNSWIIGYFPYEKPRYSFAVVMERRESLNPVGGLFVMTKLIDWMHQNTPEYLEK